MLPTIRLVLACFSTVFFLALGALALAVTTPQPSPTRVAAVTFVPAGTILALDEHPHARLFLMQASLKRTDAVERLSHVDDEEALPLRWAATDLGGEPARVVPVAVSELPDLSPVKAGDDGQVAALPDAAETSLPISEVRLPPTPQARVVASTKVKKTISRSKKKAAKKAEKKAVKKTKVAARRAKPAPAPSVPQQPANPLASLFGSTPRTP